MTPEEVLYNINVNKQVGLFVLTFPVSFQEWGSHPVKIDDDFKGLPMNGRAYGCTHLQVDQQIQLTLYDQNVSTMDNVIVTSSFSSQSSSNPQQKFIQVTL